MKESLQSVRQNFCSYFFTNSNQQNPQTNFLNSVNSTSRNIGVGSFASNLALVVICFLAFNLAFAAKPLTSNVFIDKALVDFPNVESGDQTVFQLFSHGRSGELFLDGEWKNAEQIASFVKARISNSSSKVNTLNIYGCEFAKDQKGIDAVNYLQATLNINIAASNNITGQDGDWTLEMGESKSIIKVLNFKGNLQTTVYVNAAATGTNNGSSWTNGYKTLDAALKANLNTANLLVKVAAGTYNEPSNAQATLKGANVSIIGGFDIVSGISSPSTTPSILNYSATTTAGGTSQSVGIINYAGTGGSFLMEGLTVQNLNQAALGGGVPTSSNFRGTSFYINNTNTTSPQLFRNLTLTNNTKVTDLFQIGNPWPLGSPTSTSSVTFDNVTAIGNSTSMGVLNYVGTGDLTVLNSEFCTNSSSGNFAGGIYYQSLTGGLLVNNTLFQKNTLSNGTNLHAGAILICNEYSNNMNASISITNSSFIANTDAAGSTGVNCAGAIYVSNFLTQGSVLIDNNQFINNQGPYTGALKYTSSVNGIVSNNTFNGNKGTGTYGVSGAIGGSGSLTVSNNTFANNTGTSGGAIYGNGFNSIAFDGNNFYNNTRTNSSTTFPTDIFLYNSTGSLSNNYLQSASTLYTSEGLTLGSGNNFNGVGAIPVSTVPTPTECVAIVIDNSTICSAGTNPVTLSNSSLNNICPSTTVDLSTLVTSIEPVGASLVWFTNSTHTGTAYTTPTEATAGTYYAFYYDELKNCYSPASSRVIVNIETCNTTGGTCADINYFGNPSFECYNLCPTPTANRVTNTVCDWLDAGYADPQPFFYNPNGGCVYNTFVGSNSTSVLTQGHTGNAWMGLTTSNFSNFASMHPLLGVLKEPLQPGTHTLTFWAGRIQSASYYNNPIVKIYGMDSIHQRPWTTGFSGEVTGTINPTLGTVTVNNLLNNVTNDWQQYTITFTTTEVYDALVMYHQTTNAYLMVDDFVLMGENPNCCDLNSNNQGLYCDYDGDSKLNWEDLDDDNDGILDASENPSCFYSATEVNTIYPTFATTADNITTGLINLGSYTSVFNAFDGNVALAPPSQDGSNYTTFQGSQLWGGKTLFSWSYPVALPVASFTMFSSTSIPRPLGSAGSTIMLMGSTDGVSWQQMSQAVPANVSTNIVLTNTLQPNSYFKYFKIIGVNGSTATNVEVAGSIVEIVPTVNGALYIPSSNPKPSCTPTDTDGDGIPNMFDLDSDADNCADAIEGGANFSGANLVASSIDGVSTNVTSNLGNVVGTTPTTIGVPTIAGTGQTIGTSQNAALKDALCCSAASSNITLSATTLENVCPAVTADLNSLVAIIPAETTLVWFTNATHTGTAYTTPTEATAGTYYAFYYSVANNCYSAPSAAVNVSIINCSSCKLGGTAWYDYNGEGNLADGIQGAFQIGSNLEKEVTGAETIAPANINNIAAIKLVGVNATFPYIGGVANIQTTLYNATTSEFVASKVTDSKGNYIFTNLTYDNYYMVTF
ncbi:MAG: DUF4347 domain-containing protein [Saprospiraceae bacterium]|nr:DUF4347 domain-containing protein [Saprospiraceae bacterium]